MIMFITYNLISFLKNSFLLANKEPSVSTSWKYESKFVLFALAEFDFALEMCQNFISSVAHLVYFNLIFITNTELMYQELFNFNI